MYGPENESEDIHLVVEKDILRERKEPSHLRVKGGGSAFFHPYLHRGYFPQAAVSV